MVWKCFVWTRAGGPSQQGGIDFSVMHIYMFCFRILFQIRFQHGYYEYRHDHSKKKVIKTILINRPPETTWFLKNPLYLSYSCKSLAIQPKFHEVATSIILYSKLKLFQPFGNLIENKKNTRLKTSWSKQSSSSGISNGLTEMR